MGLNASHTVIAARFQGNPRSVFGMIESRRTLGDAGIFVGHDDPALFGDAILNVLDDAPRRKELGTLAEERLRSYFH